MPYTVPQLQELRERLVKGETAPDLATEIALIDHIFQVINERESAVLTSQPTWKASRANPSRILRR